jgi:hypothetical protein
MGIVRAIKSPSIEHPEAVIASQYGLPGTTARHRRDSLNRIKVLKEIFRLKNWEIVDRPERIP